jgi:hypothetical protein
MSRDDFSTQIKRIVSQRAAYYCSSPNCRRSMLAACALDPNQVSNVGKVAHITAASIGGPRYDASITHDQRRSTENAIYLCSTCADMIDKNNGADYSVEKLKDWKVQHERWTIDRQNAGQAGGLTLVDVFLDNEGYKYPTLDLRVLNLGDEPAMLTRGVITTRRHVSLPSESRSSRLETSWSYDVEIGENEGDVREFNLSQFIPAGGADRFDIVLKGLWPNDDPALNLYEVGIELSQGPDKTAGLVLPSVLVHMPPAGRTLASSTMPFSPEERRRIRQTAKQLAQQLLEELSQSPTRICCDLLVVEHIRAWAAAETIS